jgi:oligopeptidase B
MGLAATAPAPIAKKELHEVKTPFGATRDDSYFWLRDDTRSSPAVLGYLNQENAYADQVLAPESGLRAQVRKEIADRVPPQDSSVPYFSHGYWYYTRFSPHQEYPTVARRKGKMDAPEEVLMEETAMAPREGYFSVDHWAVSPDGKLIAWTEDRVGRRQYELHVKDIATGRLLDETVKGISANILWGDDSKTLLYVVNDAALRPRWLKAHRLGTATGADPVVFDETDATFFSDLVRTNDEQFLCLHGVSMVTSEWRCAPANDPTRFQVIAAREIGHMYDVDHGPGRWYIRTNWQAPNYRIVAVAAGELTKGRSAWHEIVATRDHVLIEGLQAFDGFLALEERVEANKRLRLLPLDGKGREAPAREAPAEDPAFAMSLSPDQSPHGRWVRYDYESLSTPASTREINVDTGEQRVLKDKTVPGYDHTQYQTERVWVTARDGSRIPVSVLRRKDWRKDGKGALLQYAYGAYAYSVDARFFDYAISLADRGVVFAVAHVRGGQEMGRSWYDQGHLFQKMNTFTDFIDVTRGLVAQGYAAKDRVVALGGSGGGTLMGAVANMAPGDYKAILAIVPYVDAVTTMLDPTIPLVTREYDEWGNPHKKSDYEYMLKWSPYDNVRAQSYPALYVFTGLWDSQVQYYEPTKWVAKLRATKTDDHPLVLRINMQGGHGGASGRYQQIDARAEYLAFALAQLGYTLSQNGR